MDSLVKCGRQVEKTVISINKRGWGGGGGGWGGGGGVVFFFFNDTATTEIYTLSLHDALPIWVPLANNVVARSRNLNG